MEEQLKTNRRRISGRGQLSLVEHALCQLDSRGAANRRRFDTNYAFYDGSGNRKSASVTLHSPHGLTANDEFFLWGLLALSMSEGEPSVEFWATPHFLLKQLGCSHKPGGNDHRQFRAALKRLASVTYESDQFYDPIRRERCDVSFGFLSYQLPLDSQTSRAWRIVWDPVFFDFCMAAGGSLRFDLGLYKSLDPATRRLYLMLRKVFHRRTTSQTVELRHLAVNVLGYSSTIPMRNLREKILRSIRRLADLEIVGPPENGPRIENCIQRVGKGQFTVTLQRGRNFASESGTRIASRINDSRFYDQLREVGLDDTGITRVLRDFKAHSIERWIDVTLMATERFGSSFFKRSPQAYLIDNLKNCQSGTRTAPDWYLDIRKHEELRRKREPKSHDADAFAEFVRGGDGREQLERVIEQMTRQFRQSGQSTDEASRNAQRYAREHMRKRFATSPRSMPTSISKLLQ